MHKKEFKPICFNDIYSFQIDLTYLNKFKNSNDRIHVLLTTTNINSRFAYAYYGLKYIYIYISTVLIFLDEF